MDPGLQRFLGNAVAAGRIASTTGAFLRSHPSMYNARHGLRWNEKAVCTEISAVWLTFHPSRHISVCADGIRIGGPATDDLVMLVEDVDTGYSNWLPPMDLSNFSLHLKKPCKSKLTNNYLEVCYFDCLYYFFFSLHPIVQDLLSFKNGLI